MSTNRFPKPPTTPITAPITAPAATLAVALAAAALLVGGCAAPGARDDAVEERIDEPLSYTVKRGDRLGDIAREFTGDVERWRDIAAINGIDDPRKLREGVVLRIPAALIPERDDGEAPLETASAADAASGSASGDSARRRTGASAAPALAVRRAPVTLSPVVVNRDFELSPLGTSQAPSERASAQKRHVKVLGSYFPKGIYAQPAVYSKLLMRVAPGTLFELEREVDDWYGIVTDEGIGYLRNVDGLVLDASDASRG